MIEILTLNNILDKEFIGETLREYILNLGKNLKNKVYISEIYPFITEKDILNLEKRHLASGADISYLTCADKKIDIYIGDISKTGKISLVNTDSSTLKITDPLTLHKARKDLIYNININHLKNGVNIVDIDNTYIDIYTKIAKGTTIMPNTQIYNSNIAEDVFIDSGSKIKNSIIGKNTVVTSSHIHNSKVGEHTNIGPFAYIRPDSDIGNNVKIGDFVEIKKSVIGNDTKVSHLTYIGDAIVGEKVNFGCGTVTVNYDGKKKYTTTIADGAFIGCNTNLVAPVKIGYRAYTAAGSTITDDVPDECLAVARNKQRVINNWVKRRDI